MDPYACYCISVQPGRSLGVGDRPLLPFVFLLSDFWRDYLLQAIVTFFLGLRMPRCQVYSPPPNLAGQPLWVSCLERTALPPWCTGLYTDA